LRYSLLATTIQAGSFGVEWLPRSASAVNGRWTWSKKALILHVLQPFDYSYETGRNYWLLL